MYEWALQIIHFNVQLFMNGFVFNNFWTASVLVPSIIYECTKRSTSWTASILIFEIIKKVKMRFVRLAVFGGKMFKISIFNEKFASTPWWIWREIMIEMYRLDLELGLESRSWQMSLKLKMSFSLKMHFVDDDWNWRLDQI